MEKERIEMEFQPQYIFFFFFLFLCAQKLPRGGRGRITQRRHMTNERRGEGGGEAFHTREKGIFPTPPLPPPPLEKFKNAVFERSQHLEFFLLGAKPVTRRPGEDEGEGINRLTRLLSLSGGLEKEGRG